MHGQQNIKYLQRIYVWSIKYKWIGCVAGMLKQVVLTEFQ
jgi:hypothetical protein